MRMMRWEADGVRVVRDLIDPDHLTALRDGPEDAAANGKMPYQIRGRGIDSDIDELGEPSVSSEHAEGGVLGARQLACRIHGRLQDGCQVGLACNCRGGRDEPRKAVWRE